MGRTYLSNDAALEAMMKREWSQIKRMYEDYISGGAVGGPPSLLGGSLLHLAVWSNKEDLLSKMLALTPPAAAILEMGTSEVDNTILHEAVHGGNKQMVRMILQKKRSLIEQRNQLGETPLYTAAAVGNTDIIELLHPYVQASCSSTLIRRNDGTTILHASVHGLFFGTAVKVAQLYPHIIHHQDQKGMTALHLIASLPSKVDKRSLVPKPEYKGFDRSPRLMKALKQEYSNKGDAESGLWPSSRSSSIFRFTSGYSGFCGRLTGQGLQWSLEHLVDLLIENYEMYKELKKDAPDSSTNTATGGRALEQMETPLSMATRHGMTSVVERILFKYPREVDHVNDLGENLLHLAIKYRQEGIFNLFNRGSPIVLQRLARRLDNSGNTVLHHAGEFNEQQNWDKPGTYFPMHWEYEWFKSVKKITSKDLIEHLNISGKTARELFIDSHEKFKKDDEKCLKETASAFSVVVTLMASTAFAALYTYPGGPDQIHGKPILRINPAFHVFLVANALTIGFSLRALLYFLFVLSWRWFSSRCHLEHKTKVVRLSKTKTNQIHWNFYHCTSMILSNVTLGHQRSTMVFLEKENKESGMVLSGKFLAHGEYLLVMDPLTNCTGFSYSPSTTSSLL
ncbi:uncharacterized protein LOC116268371 isoform X1 [Nymphaea colorata]|nr:uncharacterized protein LOC116268371 isoform X1 [Nymphaea colorata]